MYVYLSIVIIEVLLYSTVFMNINVEFALLYRNSLLIDKPRVKYYNQAVELDGYS